MSPLSFYPIIEGYSISLYKSFIPLQEGIYYSMTFERRQYKCYAGPSSGLQKMLRRGTHRYHRIHERLAKNFPKLNQTSFSIITHCQLLCKVATILMCWSVLRQEYSKNPHIRNTLFQNRLASFL